VPLNGYKIKETEVKLGFTMLQREQNFYTIPLMSFLKVLHEENGNVIERVPHTFHSL
jgi:hypothetical protein